MRNFKILAKLTIAILLSAFQASAQTDIKNLGEILYAEKNYKVSSTISDSIYEMVFSKYINLDKVSFKGVNIIKNISVIIKNASPDSLNQTKNLFTLGSGELNQKDNNERDEYGYTTQIYRDKVGALFTLSKAHSKTLLNDTLVVFKSSNGQQINGFLMSDLIKAEENLKQASLKKQKAEDEKNTVLYLDAIKGYEKTLFPNDSLYVIGVNYLIQWDVDNFGRNLSIDDSLYCSGFILSSSSNLKTIKDNFVKLYKAGQYVQQYWIVDSLWVAKSFHYKDLGNLNNVISFYSTAENQSGFNLEFALNEAKKDKKRLKIYTTLNLLKNEISDEFIDKSDFLIRFYKDGNGLKVGIAEKIYGKRKNEKDSSVYNFQANIMTSEKVFEKKDANIFSSIDLTSTYSLKEYDLRLISTEPEQPDLFSLINMNFSRRYDDRQRFSNEINWDESFGQFGRISKFYYGLTSSPVKKSMVFPAYSQFTQSMDDLLQEQNDEEEKQKLIVQYSAKYGKLFVEQAFAGNVIIGMHEDLLSVALRAWKLDRKTLFTGGYSMYLYSPYDRSKRILIKVTNKKVTYLGAW